VRSAYAGRRHQPGATRWRNNFVITLLVFAALATGAMLVFAFVFGAYKYCSGVRFPYVLSIDAG